jgi:hypothetical protein
MTGKTRFVPGHGAGADTPSWQGEPAPARAPNIAAATALFALMREFDVDAAASLVIALGTLFIVTRRRAALAVTLLAGTTIHESRLFLVPLAYAVWAQRPIDARALRDLVLVAGLPVVVYLFLRSSIVALGQIYQPGYTGPLLSQRWTMIRNRCTTGAGTASCAAWPSIMARSSSPTRCSTSRLPSCSRTDGAWPSRRSLPCSHSTSAKASTCRCTAYTTAWRTSGRRRAGPCPERGHMDPEAWEGWRGVGSLRQ